MSTITLSYGQSFLHKYFLFVFDIGLSVGGGRGGVFWSITPPSPPITSFGITTSRIVMFGIAAFEIQRDPRYKGVRKLQSGSPDPHE